MSESERSDYIRPDYEKNILLLISNRTVYNVYQLKTENRVLPVLLLLKNQ